MHEDPLNVPAVAVDTVADALAVQYADPVLRRRATMLWGTRGVGKSSVVQQLAARADVPLVDLRLTTIEPVDLRGAVFADDDARRTVWFPPEFLPGPDLPEGILFLDELTAADQRLQTSAYSLILDRRVGDYRLPDGWMIVAAGNASFHGAVSHDMGTALADRMFHFHVQSTVRAFLAHALANDFSPDVMAYLQVRPDKLDDTASQLARDHLVGASPRGWEGRLERSEVLARGRRAPRLRAGPARRGERGRLLRRARRDPPRERRPRAARRRPRGGDARAPARLPRRPLRARLRARRGRRGRGDPRFARSRSSASSRTCPAPCPPASARRSSPSS